MLETTVTGVAVRAVGPCVVAVTGPPAPVTVDGAPAAMGQPVTVPDGAVLDVGPAQAGLRSYLAVAGGIDVPAVLGSRSTDLLSGLGPPRLRDGDRLPIGRSRSGDPPAAVADPATLAGRAGAHGAPRPAPRLVHRGGARDPPAHRVHGVAGVEPGRAAPRRSRRWSGPCRTSCPSEGVVLGAVQVPADGQPLVFLADHPTTGGYPVIAVVDDADVDRCAQARPGDRGPVPMVA